jgi:hypothetical protein
MGKVESMVVSLAKIKAMLQAKQHSKHRIALEGKGQNATIAFTTTCNYLVFATTFLLSTTIVTSC